VVALPIGDDLQPPHQEPHEVHEVVPPLKSCSKSDFINKLANILLGLTILHLFTRFYQQCCNGVGVKAFFFAKKLSCHFFHKKLSKNIHI
jgi:hypothetical protein